MRVSLRAKILGSFALIVLMAIGTAVGAGNRLTRNRFADYSYRRDVSRAVFLAPMFADWLARTGDGAKLPFPFSMEPPSTPDRLPRERRGGTRMMDMMGHRFGAPGPVAFDLLVVTDADGKVLMDTTGQDRAAVDPGRHEHAVVRNGRETLGYLYVGRMIPDSTHEDDVSFFRGVGAASWVIAGAVFAVAMVLGILLTRHIVGPVSRLNAAAGAVGAGDLTVRVPSGRRDELGELSMAFNEMASSLESAEERRRRFIADSAHELRTPVSLIRARIEMMEEGIYPLDSEGLEALSAESKRLNALVEQLRLLADLDSRPSEAPPTEERRRTDRSWEPVDLADILREAIDSAEPALRHGGISAELRLEGSPPSVRGDRDELYRLVANLLGNAARHARSRILVSLEAMSTRAGGGATGGIRFRVEDDGPGIPEELRERVFERYYRVDASRSRAGGGSGLGLAICHGIARSHGGSIRAGASPALGGASMTVEIPV
jgi:two-component system, OmpR family, sensor histidine kinase BaeS